MLKAGRSVAPTGFRNSHQDLCVTKCAYYIPNAAATSKSTELMCTSPRWPASRNRWIFVVAGVRSSILQSSCSYRTKTKSSMVCSDRLFSWRRPWLSGRSARLDRDRDGLFCIFCRRGIVPRRRRGVFSYKSACGRGASGPAGRSSYNISLGTARIAARCGPVGRRRRHNL